MSGFDFSTSIAQTSLPNPILTASGCAANGKELSAARFTRTIFLLADDLIRSS